jgi:hypothetical protein
MLDRVGKGFILTLLVLPFKGQVVVVVALKDRLHL